MEEFNVTQHGLIKVNTGTRVLSYAKKQLDTAICHTYRISTVKK